LNRREFLECATLLVAGMTASQVGFTLTEEQKIYLATAPDYIAHDVALFSKEQRFLIAEFTEIIIPETNTPGAKEAGVPKYIELMVSQWLNDEERNLFMEGLESVASISKQRYGKNTRNLTQTEMLKILESLEEDASDDPWYAFANTAGAFSDEHKSPFICQLKELTIWGFFTSEVGSKKALRYNPMPMRFKGDIPLKDEDSTWAGKAS